MLKIAKLFEDALVPIDLPDDGLRFRSAGLTKSGNYRFVSLENPNLIAQVLAERAIRSRIRSENIRRFS